MQIRVTMEVDNVREDDDFAGVLTVGTMVGDPPLIVAGEALVTPKEDNEEAMAVAVLLLVSAVDNDAEVTLGLLVVMVYVTVVVCSS